MNDIDVDQWRADQQLLLRSAKAARRIVVLHDNGVIRKIRHSQGLPIAGSWSDANDPQALAHSLYEANKETCDFVMVMERDSVDTYFAKVQDSWDPDQDLDDFVTYTFRSMDDYPDGIVTYPGPARTKLGLQWRLGASHEEIEAAVAAYAKPGQTIILGVIQDGGLWASLVLDIGEGNKVTSITTADPAKVSLEGGPQVVLGRLVAWQEQQGKDVSTALVLGREQAEAFLDAEGSEKVSVLAKALASGQAAVRR
jgi:hypothetical protein